MTKIQSQFEDYVRRIQHFQEALSLMAWDLRTGAPKKGVEARAEAIGTLSDEVFGLMTSSRMGEFLEALEARAHGLDGRTAALVRECRREYDRNRRIPRERYRAFVVLTAKAESAWEDARNRNDFALLQPYLEEIVAMTREFAGYWGYEKDPYDPLLDLYEPGVRTAEIDPLFATLRKATVALVGEIAESGRRPDPGVFARPVPVETQQRICRWALKTIGYDFDRGRLDETAHPFQITLNAGDVRVTTKYVVEDFRSALFSAFHEGGHALYEQGIDPDLAGTPLYAGASLGVHESQSRFWENVVGRSRAFWEHYYGELTKRLGPAWNDLDIETFYAGINDVRPSPIRTEADEVTYNLHILLRYELERALISGDLKVADLPEAWREKTRALLGFEPNRDADGVLQDVHWASGSFGYFPTYTLGNVYAAQFWEAMDRDLGGFDRRLAEGDVAAVREWLREKVHRPGRELQPHEVLKRATGTDRPAAEPLLRYWREKFGPLYGL
ncbi:carboxypeptidase M32 [Kyrpidia spormannii]|uniref:Carboxypeptidase 1 n=1 Tax=Kyrpidia spormannii TaxID=2055160 RepID=A0ACA8Z7I6_9BACL|nr:carboxypeptidase M32 [Kyrpidia spormannii]CAB3391484.1 Carboxypeptidase 1 [Kyrpidia spormannii]